MIMIVVECNIAYDVRDDVISPVASGIMSPWHDVMEMPSAISHSRFKVTFPVPIQGWISQASKLQSFSKFQEFIFLGRQVTHIIYAMIKQLFMGFTPALYGNTLPIYATLNWEFAYGV